MYSNIFQVYLFHFVLIELKKLLYVLHTGLSTGHDLQIFTPNP